jgi:hypothetical protein
MDKSVVQLSVCAGKCVAIRSAFDLFLRRPDFLPAMPSLSVSRYLSLSVGFDGVPQLVVMRLIANTTWEVKNQIEMTCYGTFRFRMEKYVRGLIAGENKTVLWAFFGPFEHGDAYVELARDMMATPIEELPKQIENVIQSRDVDQSVTQASRIRLRVHFFFATAWPINGTLSSSTFGACFPRTAFQMNVPTTKNTIA